MTAKEVTDLFFKVETLDLAPKELLYCLGMSKMTVARENTKAKYYEQVELVELLEMIGRVADLRYMGTEMAEQPLANKIEFLLDDLFEPFGLIRQPRVGEDADAISASDSEY